MTIYYNLSHNSNKNPIKTHKTMSLAKHGVSFGAMKKSQFNGTDFIVVEKYKAPIEKFNIHEDLQNWAKTQVQKITDMDFGGRKAETKEQRTATLKKWYNFIFKENNTYNFTTALLILSAITKGIKPNNDKLPPVLDETVLEECINEIEQNSKRNRKYQFDLSKMYETKLRSQYLEDKESTNSITGWVIIPSQDNDPKNFKTNVEKLKTLSYKTWCTKSSSSKDYLKDGDFHIYLENGSPKIALRFFKDKIWEIEGTRNNGRIPVEYIDEISKHIDTNHLKLMPIATFTIKRLKEAQQKIQKIQNALKNAIKTNDAKIIFEYLGYEPKEDENGYLTISSYKQPSDSFTFTDCGIDENALFKKVKQIEGDADFRNSQITSLNTLKIIGGNAFILESQAKYLEQPLKLITKVAIEFENRK